MSEHSNRIRSSHSESHGADEVEDDAAGNGAAVLALNGSQPAVLSSSADKLPESAEPHSLILQNISDAMLAPTASTTPALHLEEAVSGADHLKFSHDRHSGWVAGSSQVLSSGAEVAQVLDTDTSYSEQNGFLIKSVNTGGLSSWEILRDGNGDGVYTAVAHGDCPVLDLVGLAHSLEAVDHLL